MTFFDFGDLGVLLGYGSLMSQNGFFPKIQTKMQSIMLTKQESYGFCRVCVPGHWQFYPYSIARFGLSVHTGVVFKNHSKTVAVSGSGAL